MSPAEGRPLRILTLLEANGLTGVVKAFVEFCAVAPIEASAVLFRRKDEAPRLEQTLHAAGVTYEYIPEQFPFDARVILRLRELVGRARPDLIESHSVKSHAVVWSSRLWKRIPWVAYHHGYTTTNAKVRLYNQIDSVTLRNADRVVMVAHALQPALLRRGVRPERLCVVHNALGSARALQHLKRSAARKELSLPEAAGVVLSVGRLSAEKGVADLLRAFALLASGEHVRLLLVIVGDGPERRELENLARQLRIAEFVRFAGHVADPSGYFTGADVLAIPSLSEGLPYTLLEALAAELPVVATAVGGIPETVTDRVCALLVPPKEPRSMAAAIKEVLNDHELAARLTAAGKRKVMLEFAPRARAEQLLQLFSEVLEVRKRRSEAGR